MHLPPVIGAGAERNPNTGDYQIVLFVHPLQDEEPDPESLKVPGRFQGLPVVVRQSRWDVPDEEDHEEDPCNPGRHRHGDNSDFRFLDWGKILAPPRSGLIGQPRSGPLPVSEVARTAAFPSLLRCAVLPGPIAA